MHAELGEDVCSWTGALRCSFDVTLGVSRLFATAVSWPLACGWWSGVRCGLRGPEVGPGGSSGIGAGRVGDGGCCGCSELAVGVVALEPEARRKRGGCDGMQNRSAAYAERLGHSRWTRDGARSARPARAASPKYGRFPRRRRLGACAARGCARAAPRPGTGRRPGQRSSSGDLQASRPPGQATRRVHAHWS